MQSVENHKKHSAWWHAHQKVTLAISIALSQLLKCNLTNYYCKCKTNSDTLLYFPWAPSLRMILNMIAFLIGWQWLHRWAGVGCSPKGPLWKEQKGKPQGRNERACISFPSKNGSPTFYYLISCKIKGNDWVSTVLLVEGDKLCIIYMLMCMYHNSTGGRY